MQHTTKNPQENHTLTTSKQSTKTSTSAKRKRERGKRIVKGKGEREGIDKPLPPSRQPGYIPPQCRPDPRNTDPAKPAADPKEEEFCNFIAQNYSGAKAYQIAVNPKCPNKTASRRASDLRNRKDLARRIIATQAEIKRHAIPKAPQKEPEPPQEAPQEPQHAPAVNSQVLTRDDLAQVISQAVRQAKTSTEKTQAVKLAQSLLGLDDQGDAPPVDPCALIQHLAQIAGRSPQDLAREAGGLRAMLEHVAEYSKAPPSLLRRTVGAWYRHLCQEDTPEDTGTPEA